ncbi:RNA polymerase subunit sigma-70 [Paractinoplanes maris]|uniref:RNA polymerase subunit sigma-70 n=1 Tax=Paractinoplanes maris TaxID=1734446 RepID=UPI002020E611|nr:RNA polymerase subunit sigma-70 [Actinoplanes maris]
MADEAGFTAATGPLRREILAHCYRMLGSSADAEDAVQETFLRAWRGFERFEGRASARTWLHQIATNVCLRLIEQRGRRALPSGLGGPEQDWALPARAAPARTRWLGPLPVDPADEAGTRQDVRLAFVAALQHLPASQRAVLLLRDVADLPADEVATVLGTTTIAVNSALRRARDRIARRAPDPRTMSEPGGAELRARLHRYVDAFQAADVGALAAVLREDVTLEMPPHATWFAGRDAVLGFLGTHVLREPGRFAMVEAPLRANGQPTYAMYVREPDGEFAAHALQILDVAGDGIRHIHIYLDPDLLPSFAAAGDSARPPGSAR